MNDEEVMERLRSIVKVVENIADEGIRMANGWPTGAIAKVTHKNEVSYIFKVVS